MENITPPPFTLEEAHDLLMRLEDIATLERDMGDATRFVLGNLLIRLDTAGIIDIKAFLADLLAQSQTIQATPLRGASQALVSDLLQQVLAVPVRGHSAQ